VSVFAGAGETASRRKVLVTIVGVAVPGRGPSRTAVLTAAARALLREQPPPWVLDDYLASELAGEEGRRLRERLERELPAPYLLSFTRWVGVRARWPEDLVEEAIGGGVRQYVILGAGLDSFAYRRSDLSSRLVVFEVDHPSSQTWKRERLSALGVELPPNLIFAPVDFEREALADGLRAAGFDSRERAVFSWIGVTMYLSLDAIETTLSTIARCAPGTRLVLTYNLPRNALQGMGSEMDAVLAPMMADLGEPMVSFFTASEIAKLLQDHGYQDIVHVGPQEAANAYFAGSDARFAGAQRLLKATVA